MDISKLDAAKRQLEVAINLFFKQADPVSIHTLTAAAHQLLMDIGNPERITSFLKQSPLIKKEYFKEYLKKINEAENFFKHAQNDSGTLLAFNPEQTEFLLLDAIEMYIQLTKEMPEDMTIFRVWFLVKYPDILSQEIQKQLVAKGLNVNICRAKTRLEFYASFKDALIHSKNLGNFQV